MEIIQSDILKMHNYDAIVIPVNCVGIMGAGLAKDFALANPDLAAAYKTLCSEHLLELGNSAIIELKPEEINSEGKPNHVVFFPTKNHWKDNSDLKMIDKSLESTYNMIRHFFISIKSIAFPLIGAGLGRLDAENVLALLEKHALANTNVETVIVVRQRLESNRLFHC